MKEEFRADILPVAEIEASAALQVRTKIDHHTVADYADAIKHGGAIMPPLVVFAEKGSERYLLADGFHRLPAFKMNDIEEVACHVYEGGIHEALGYALAANDTHGLRRNNKDKRNAVMLALKDPHWGTWNATDISRLCRVSAPTVVKIREEMVLAGEINQPDTVKTMRGGKVVEQKATFGKKNNSKNLESSNSANKSGTKPARRSPKTQDQVNLDEFLAAVTAIRQIPHDGTEAVRRWGLREQTANLIYCRDWLNEAIAAQKKNAA